MKKKEENLQRGTKQRCTLKVFRCKLLMSDGNTFLQIPMVKIGFRGINFRERRKLWLIFLIFMRILAIFLKNFGQRERPKMKIRKSRKFLPVKSGEKSRKIPNIFDVFQYSRYQQTNTNISTWSNCR